MVNSPDVSAPSPPLVVGVSSCLLGHPVRYDGSHKRHAYIHDHLSKYFEFRPFCPEVLAGFGTPRPTIRLAPATHGLRVVEVARPTVDLTAALRQASREILSHCEDLSGYLLKKDSPSCGMERVRVYPATGVPQKNGTGIFAAELMRQFPALPVEEEGRLSDPVLRENFIERVYVYHRWQQLIRRPLTAENLIDFHTRHKFLLLAHDERCYRALGRALADLTKQDLKDFAQTYIAQLMTGLKQRATRKTHTNVLMHISGYLKNSLDRDAKKELAEILDNYRRGLVPLVVPLTLLKHHFRAAPHPYIQAQYYIDPYPETLMLRNQV